MITLMQGGGRLFPKALALALGMGIISGSWARSDDGPWDDAVEPGPVCPPGFGTLGWAPPDCYPGFYGFALSFHRGYGYGDSALGVGASGGYPFYGGPGYLHPEPPLNRFGHLIPFTYYCGPGYPFTFQVTGPLIVTEPVVMQVPGGDLAHERGSPVYPYNVGYGPFTGVLPYPENYFAPYTAAAAASGSSAMTPMGAPPSAPISNLVRNFGIDEESVADVDGVRGMKVVKIYPGTPAEKAGLKPGDVIRSVNGYLTVTPGNLSWIIMNKAPDKALKINVRSATDGTQHSITIELPTEPVDTERPPYLPPVGDGPPPSSR